MLQERCAGADTISLVAQLLHRSKTHLPSMLPRKYGALVEDFYFHMVCFAKLFGVVFDSIRYPLICVFISECNSLVSPFLLTRIFH